MPRGHTFFALTSLALWLLRQSWGLLVIANLGIVAALVLVCAVPLYSDLAATAGLRNYLATSPAQGSIIAQSDTELISTRAVGNATGAIQQAFGHNLGPFLTTAAPQFALETQSFSILSRAGVQSGDKIDLLGTDTSHLLPHIRVLQGHLPNATSQLLEMMVTSQTAKDLQLSVGSVLMSSITFHSETRKPLSFQFPLRVSGIFTQLSQNDLYWHGENFDISPIGDRISIYKGLAANNALLSQIAQLCSNPVLQDRTFDGPAHLLWYYQLDLSQISILNLDTITQGFSLAQLDIANNPLFGKRPYIENTLLYLPSDNNALAQYQSRITVANLPVRSLVILVLGMLLFFVSFMTDLLVERQRDAIAVLRSRGASRSQIVTLFLVQGVIVGLATLVLGPLLVFPAVALLAHFALPVQDQGALDLLAQPLPLLLDMGWLPLVTLAAALATMAVSLLRATARDVLTARREAARTKSALIMQRLGLDGFMTLLALLGFAFSIYLLNAHVLDARLRLVLLSPLTQFEVVFLGLALMLLFLRLFPLLLNLGAALVRRSRGASMQLAIIQMARASREPARMISLLALALAFAVFTVVFTASQAQRLTDIALYRTGADFLGTLPTSQPATTAPQVQRTTNLYRHIPGVTSATLGYIADTVGGAGDQSSATTLIAVDADTFAQTAYWTRQNADQPLSELMQQLVEARAAANGVSIPAFVDASTWDALHLSRGGHFTLTVTLPTSVTLDFVALGELRSIPVPNGHPTGAILTDYQTLAPAYLQTGMVSLTDIAANTVWLCTSSAPSALATIHAALTSGPLKLDSLVDRRALINELGSDPLYLDLLGIMILGAVVALLLAFAGNLVGSWFRVYSHRINFAVLRALGATQEEIVSIFTWEQAIVYTMALLLGIGLGFLFAYWVVPTLVYTGAGSQNIAENGSGGGFFALQSIPPVQIIVPPTLVFILGALVLLCLLSLFTMGRAALASSLGKTLRLNED